ncbi:uncharacterized protein [Rutidosis leptorrhynchoides]|uniref:uncharacterized protein n=1 Tax=Rutidosis leptorrhynchoides TaxID=125765 RepID=UPI003A9A0091
MKIISLNIRGSGLDDKDKLKLNWFKRLCNREKPNFLALQETKCQNFPEFWIEKFWGNLDYKYCCKKAKGNSGGLLMVWDPNLFVTNHIVERGTFIAIKGNWKSVGEELVLINVYGPQNDEGKKQMWKDLKEVMNYDEALWMIFGDFNEVRFASERKNTFFFIENRAKWFNDFIKDCNLLDIPLGGRLYTRISDNGHKFSKLDRFLISENVLQKWPNLNAVVLDKKYTDHCPIMLQEGNIDFGPKPIKVFDEWIKHKDAQSIVEKAWSMEVKGWRHDVIFREKLKNVKMELKKWYSTSQCKLKGEIEELTKKVIDWELKAEVSNLSDIDLLAWNTDRDKLFQKEKNQTENVKTKSKVQMGIRR